MTRGVQDGKVTQKEVLDRLETEKAEMKPMDFDNRCVCTCGEC